MKKTLIAVAAALLLIGGFAFAQDASSFTFGAWLRTVFAPVASDGENNYTNATNSWGGFRDSRIGVTGTAADGLVGLKADYFIDQESVGLGDNAYLWLQPHEMIKVSAGKFDSPEMGMRGDICYGSWNWLRPSWIGDEGYLFSGNSGNRSVALQLTPMEGLYVYGMIPMYGDWDAGFYNNEAAKSYKVWGKGEVAASYVIEGIGKIKVGYFGKYAKEGDYERLGNIEAAFDLTAVENLFLGLGFRYALGDGETISGEEALMRFAVGVSYQVTPELKVSASGSFSMYDDTIVEIDPTFDAGVGIDYALMDGVGLTADFRYKSEINDGEDDGIAFLIGLTKSVGSNGVIGAGFQGLTNAGKAGGFVGNLGFEDNFAWVIPVKFEMWL